MLLFVVLLLLLEPVEGAGGVPAICKGWPAKDSAIVNATNYTNPDLPDLLTFLNGSRVTGPGPAWDARRAEIGSLLQQYFYGTLPPETPPLVDATATQPVAVRGGLSQHINLTFLVLGKV